jgi:hypothetical protein
LGFWGYQGVKQLQNQEGCVMKNRELNLHQMVGRTCRSASEAFKDADYAISISRGKTEWEDAKEFLGHMVWITPCLGLVVYFIYAYLTNQ